MTRTRTYNFTKTAIVSQEEEDRIVMAAATKADMETMFSKINSKQNTRGLEPNNYYGLSSENAKDWLNRFQNFAALSGLEDEKKILTFRLLLKGAGSTWFDNLSDNDAKDFDTVVQKFKDTFMNQSKNWINTHRLETRKLQPKETCEAYINEIVNIANQIDLTEKETTKALIRGLPSTMRAQIIAFNPTTLDDTIQRIYLSEASQRLQQNEELSALETGNDMKMSVIMTAISNMTDTVKQSIEHLKNGQDTQPIQNTYRRTYDQQGRSNEYHPPQRYNQWSQPGPSRQQTNGSRPSWNQPSNRQTGPGMRRCYSCGSPNHLVKNCYSSSRMHDNYKASENRNYINRVYYKPKNDMLPRRQFRN